MMPPAEGCRTCTELRLCHALGMTVQEAAQSVGMTTVRAIDHLREHDRPQGVWLDAHRGPSRCPECGYWITQSGRCGTCRPATPHARRQELHV